MASVHVFLSILNIRNLSLCYFRIAHGCHSGHKFCSLKSVYAKHREFYKDIAIVRNNRKKYIHKDCETGSNEIFTMLEKIESETESDIEDLLKDSETEYIEEEPVQDNKKENHQLLTPEATVYVEDEVLYIDRTPAKSLKRKVAEFKWKRTTKFVKAKKCTLEVNVLLDIPENANLLVIFQGTTYSNELNSTETYQQPNPEKIRPFLGIMSISKLPN